MNDSDQSRHIIQSDGETGVVVELIHLGDVDEEEHLRQEEFLEVQILDTGWLRCVGPLDKGRSGSDGVAVDYIPPERVNKVFSTEPE